MFDKLFPFFVGYRTEVIGFAVAVLQILGIFSVLEPAKVDGVSKVLVGLGGATLAAKLERR